MTAPAANLPQGRSRRGGLGRSPGWSSLVAIAVLAFWFLLGLAAPLIAPHADGAIISEQSYLGLGEASGLGTDYLGRDVLSRIMYGARMTLSLALAATAIAFVTGALAGTAAGVLGGRWDQAMSRINDVFFGFPQIIMALLVISSLGPSIPVQIVTVGLIEGTRVYRIARSLAQSIMTMDFVMISRARGERLPWIVLNDMLPYAFGPLATDLGLRFTYSILLLSSLSFLGLGVQPPAADWGMMVRENLTGLYFAAPASIVAALAIFSVTFSVNHQVDQSLARRHRDITDEVQQ